MKGELHIERVYESKIVPIPWAVSCLILFWE